MARDRYGEEIEKADPKKLEPWTYKIQGHENSTPTTITVKCCLCRQPMERRGNGWCYRCNTWPINVTPMRVDDGGHPVDTDGLCRTCQDSVLTKLEPHPGEWIDTGIVSKRLLREQVREMVAGIVKQLSGKGWPEKEVRLRRDMIPRRWKRLPLTVVDQTELGYAIVLFLISMMDQACILPQPNGGSRI